MVQETLTRAQEHIIHSRLDLLGKRTVALDAQLEVCTVVAHHIHLACRQFVTILLVHPTRHRLDDFRVVERIDVVPAFAVATIRREKSLVLQSLEGHSKVVTLRVQRIARMFQLVEL